MLIEQQLHVISDTHFFHANITKYCSRPADVDALMEKNWREIVRCNDIVIHLGDFAFKDAGRAAELCKRLPGTKILILGNHDRSRATMRKIGFDEVWPPSKDFRIVGEYMFQVIDGRVPVIADSSIIKLSHRPIPDVDFPYFHGHIHNNPCPFDDDRHYYPMPRIRGRNVCVEVINYRPVPLMALLGDLDWMEKNLPIKPRSGKDG